jgi:hypothetical protein
MDLLHNIRSDRARQRKKQPYKRTVFNTVSCIIRENALGADFLEPYNHNEYSLSEETMVRAENKVKIMLETPPFSLVSKEEYELAVTIETKLDNPYLAFARSPEEMLLSVPLYETNPSLGSALLLRYHFETLLLYQRAKEELAELEKRSGNGNGTAGPGKEMKSCRGKPSQLNDLQEHIQRLQTFIANVENTGF